MDMSISRRRLIASLAEMHPELKGGTIPLGFHCFSYTPIHNYRGQLIHNHVIVQIVVSRHVLYLGVGAGLNKGSRTHRSYVECPNCLCFTPTGRFGQHIRACLKRKPRVCEQCERTCDDLLPCPCQAEPTLIADEQHKIRGEI